MIKMRPPRGHLGRSAARIIGGIITFALSLEAVAAIGQNLPPVEIPQSAVPTQSNPAPTSNSSSPIVPANAGETGSNRAPSSSRSCVSILEAVHRQDKDTCVEAHVFDVVELTDGTRFLDVCPGTATDDDCRFTILSPKEDRDEVGDLRRYQDQDIHIRGVVHAMRGRMGLVLSHNRQFNMGPEKFKPNPRLLRNFDGQADRLPVRDPNLKASGRHRTFMNTRDTEPTPTGVKR